MKMLIVGIDGLGIDSLQALGLKRLNTRLHGSGVMGNPSIENVISRGWPEIYTGKNAYETGGFYQVPIYKNGKILPTQNTGLTKIKKIITSGDLLWKVLNNRGYSVGLFTIPTITQPEIVDGFSFAATGAGKFKSDLLENEILPKNLLDSIRIKNTDFGIRMGYGGYIPRNLLHLEEYLNKHISDYFFTLRHVLNKKHVDVCFAATRFIAAMAFKFIGICTNMPNNDYEASLRELVLSICNTFDEELDRFINDSSPEHLFIVSDHGITEYKYDLNLNELLAINGLIKRRYSIKSIIKPYVNRIRSTLYDKPFELNAIPKYHLESSSFFSIGYMNALYLRDARLGGDTYSLDQAYEISKSMSDKLNTLCSELDLNKYLLFRPVNSAGLVGAGDNSVPIPNIICDMQTGINNSERKKAVFVSKEYYFNRMFKKGFYGEHSGCKSNDTIAFYAGNKNKEIAFPNLTSLYKSILRVMEN